jgi:hypothetical protein
MPCNLQPLNTTDWSKSRVRPIEWWPEQDGKVTEIHVPETRHDLYSTLG